MPELTEKVEAFLNIEPMQWSDRSQLLLGQPINKYKHLGKRINAEPVTPLVDKSKETLQVKEEHSQARHGEAQPHEQPALPDTKQFE